MRTGILSDEYVKKKYPAFFKQNFSGKSILPYYDLYAIAQVTMDNPFQGASEIVENYVPMNVPNVPVVNQALNIPPAPATPSSPTTSIDPNMQTRIGTGSNSPPPATPPLQSPFQSPLSPLQTLINSIFGDDTFQQHGTMQSSVTGSSSTAPSGSTDAPPRTLPNLRPNFGYNPQK